ncbi:OLC1v1034306C1 [Oldenlandia corymbosa var. corymbosa]|uniref:OLC1v1034306C1 n=1 Tax=Oldenlandia corymbosa var. corymbosa TaxID=529605 RepID=A0AAV1CSW1_OLDCO|nr:OLC1v1034306C1 [Oldenlandia corymbosa var. corymbosa]
MRNITACYSEHAIKVSNSYCSGASNQVYLSPNLIPSVQNAVTCIYRVNLSAQKPLFIRITWSNSVTQGFSLGVSDDSRSLSRNLRQLKKAKGTKAFDCCNSSIEVFWDLSRATYDLGPEPVSGFYVVVWVSSELGLYLGDLEEELDCKNGSSVLGEVANFSLVSRSEHLSGNALYSTRAQFSDGGTCHDLVIKYSGQDTGSKCAELNVSIDKKNVIQVKRLQWNFRGNQTIFVDGLLVDMMWDVHDWFFDPASGYGVFLFRTRSGFDGRLWLEEKIVEQKDQEKIGFSLLICACKASH